MGVRFLKTEILKALVDEKKKIIHIYHKDEFFDWYYDTDYFPVGINVAESPVRADRINLGEDGETYQFYTVRGWGFFYEGKLYRKTPIVIHFPMNYTFPFSLKNINRNL